MGFVENEALGIRQFGRHTGKKAEPETEPNAAAEEKLPRKR